MSKSWLWVFVFWFISLLVGVLWGLLSLAGVNATRIGEGLGKYSATVQAVSPALLVLLVLALILLTLAYAILTHKLRRATDSLASIAAYQSKLLAANQRAYLCIEPLGILLTVGGTRVLGHAVPEADMQSELAAGSGLHLADQVGTSYQPAARPYGRMKNARDAAAITAVAAQPQIAIDRDSVSRPMTLGLRTISIITAMSGAASTPLTTAAQ